MPAHTVTGQQRDDACKSKTAKKADVAEDPKVFDHAGLLAIEPPGARRVALYLVVRQAGRKVADKGAATLPAQALYATRGQRQWSIHFYLTDSLLVLSG
jgi:hypothetical protein